ncbi:hypothetical protein LTR08_001905 [Meristemomyces frigidus]|nr:hypothetical protein LTR08_001905 [Meristemomyces frigidus]
MSPQRALIIGATGFVGGHLVELLAKKHPEMRLLCLTRDATPAKIEGLKSLNSHVDVLEGTLEDSELISQAAEKVDIVIHVAHSDHVPSVQAVLTGLKRQVATGSRKPPLYLHMSGCGVIADNVFGERVEHPKEWTDVGFRLDEHGDHRILEAGTESEGRIRTSILFPGLIYGIGKTRRSSAWVPLYSNLAKAAGHADTRGPGEVSQYCIHVQDVALAVVCVLDALLEGKIRGGEDGLFFVTSQEPTISWSEINSVLGDIMYSKGLVKMSGAKPFPESITEPLGHCKVTRENVVRDVTVMRELIACGNWGGTQNGARESLCRSVVKEMLEIAMP